DLVAPHRRAERERPLEAAVAPLEAAPSAVLGLAVGLPLAAKSEGVTGEAHLDVLGRHAREVDANDERLGGLLNVDGRRERRGEILMERRPAEEAVEQPVHLVLNRGQLAARDRAPAYECHVSNLLV